MDNKAKKLNCVIIPLGRSTFDTYYAKVIYVNAMQVLKNMDINIICDTDILFENEQIKSYINELKNKNPDFVIILQTTFTDAGMIVEIVKTIDVPFLMWSFPEKWTSGRLRLNSFCGINLAGFILGKADIICNYVHGKPEDEKTLNEIKNYINIFKAIDTLKKSKVLIVGDYPNGFDACSYDEDTVNKVFGTKISKIDINSFIESVMQITDDAVSNDLDKCSQYISNINELDKNALLKTLKIYRELQNLTEKQEYNAFAIRCWPEFFTKLGGAACGAIAMMNDNKTPCGCEADLYGVITCLALQALSNSPAFNTDLVDVDFDNNLCVFWHCGQASRFLSKDSNNIKGTIHSNRKLPLLYEFPLKPGKITIARFSQSKNKIRLFIGSGEMLDKPLPFSGTSGVARLDGNIKDTVDTIIYEGLEHHTAIVYGEHKDNLTKLARQLHIETVELTK